MSLKHPDKLKKKKVKPISKPKTANEETTAPAKKAPAKKPIKK